MNLLSILVEKSANKIQEKIQPILESFYNEGINVEGRIYYINPFYYLNYSVSIDGIKDYPANDFINIFKFCISNAIYEYIRDYEVPGLIQHIISTDYCYFNLKERMEIYRNSLNILENENIDKFSSIDDSFNFKIKILHQLTNYFNNNTEINLGGFILFRLKDYLLKLNETIERAVEDFLVDREYNEFIGLLRYFVDIQESKLDIVNIVFDEETNFKIYDKHNRLLNYDYITSIAFEFSENNINKEDMLINSLITMAPKEIIVHRSSTLKDTRVVKVLQEVFPGKVHFCNSCKYCKVKANANKD